MLATARQASTMAKVLIVEDDKRLADTVAELISSSGHAVLTVEPFEPDVVFLDLSLPSLTGFEVAKQIRDTCGRGVRLIAFTGWAECMTRSVAKTRFDMVLVKPATLEQILSVIGGDGDAREA
jgi:CheY-like chemotaxis protein